MTKEEIKTLLLLEIIAPSNEEGYEKVYDFGIDSNTKQKMMQDFKENKPLAEIFEKIQPRNDEESIHKAKLIELAIELDKDE